MDVARSDEFKELTTAEYLQVMTRVLSDDLLSTLKYEIRFERHGNDEMPGDVEAHDGE